MISKGLRNYGLPYMGSKSSIVKDILKVLPSAENFYDLFGGGGCVTHCALDMFSHKWTNFHFNEIKADVTKLISAAIAGKYNYKNFKPEFVTREMFNERKSSCAYTRVVWSFGNNQKDYMFSKEIEKQKHSLHNAVVFGEFDSFAKKVLEIVDWPEGLTVKDRRLYCRRKIVARKGELEQLERLQQLEQLERLQQLEQLERLAITSTDYRNVKIKPNSIIYCDIPYQGTVDYGNMFNNQDFFDWAAKHSSPVFISEFEIKDPRLKVIWEKPRMQRLAANAKNGKRKVFMERLYANAAALKLMRGARCEFRLELSS